MTRRLNDALRSGKRQAAPFREGLPKPDPKTPGRKSGPARVTHGPCPPPEQITECHRVQLPGACPHRRGRLAEAGTADQFQTEIPRKLMVRKFGVPSGPLRRAAS